MIMTQLAILNAPEPATTALVPAVVTPWTPQQIGQALVEAWTRSFGAGPTAGSIAVLLSQWALETAWGKACWNSDLGNARPPTTRGDVLCMQIPGGKVSEVIGGREYFFSPPSVGSTFRAFESLEDGATFYLGLLHDRFAHAWPAVLAGDPSAYSVSLHESHYYTADVAVYTRTMRSLFDHFYSTAVTGIEHPRPELPPEIVSAVRMAHSDLWLATLDADLDGKVAGNIPAELDTLEEQ